MLTEDESCPISIRLETRMIEGLKALAARKKRELGKPVTYSDLIRDAILIVFPEVNEQQSISRGTPVKNVGGFVVPCEKDDPNKIGEVLGDE